MKMCLIFAVVAVLVGVGLVASAPIAPRDAETIDQIVLQPLATESRLETFAAHERACVIVIGDGRTRLGLYVFDPHGNCVAWDDFDNFATKDDLAVEWFPPVQARYVIDVVNAGRSANKADFVLK